VLVVADSSVSPSGALFTTYCAPSVVAPPALFSTTIDWPSRCASAATKGPRHNVGARAGEQRHDDVDRPVLRGLRCPQARGARMPRLPRWIAFYASNG
jgi:hypothetical protein